MNKNKSCILPWMGIAIERGSSIKVCCNSEKVIEIIDENSDLLKIFNGGHYKKVRTSYSKGEIPKDCSSCFLIEKKGIDSRRLRWEGYNTTEKLYNILDFNSLDQKIRYIAINFSTVCNLNCIMCTSEFSSSWIELDKKLIKEFPFRSHVNKFLNIDRIPNSIINQILNIAEDIEILEIKGGEPLIDPRCLNFLEEFANRNSKTFIHLTSNITKISDRILKIFSKIQNLGIDISIDATGDLFKYLRVGNKIPFSLIEKNMKRVLSTNPVLPRINIVTSPYNLWNSYKIIDWIRDLGIEIILNWCPITLNPRYLSPAVIPYDMRKEAADNFKNFIKKEKVPKIMLLDIDFTLDFLERENPENWSDEKLKEMQKFFIQWTNKMNQIRNMDVYEIVPQLEKVKQRIGGRI